MFKKIFVILTIICVFSGCSIQSDKLTEDKTFISETDTMVKSDCSGYTVSVEDLKEIIDKAYLCDYCIRGGDLKYYFEDGDYYNYSGETYDEFINSFCDVFSSESGIAEEYFSSHKGYLVGNELYIQKSLDDTRPIEEDIRNISGSYDAIYIYGGTGSNPTFIRNEFEITERKENSIVLKNTAYYNEENNTPVKTYEYKMVIEDGKWKFVNFENCHKFF